VRGSRLARQWDGRSPVSVGGKRHSNLEVRVWGSLDVDPTLAGRIQHQALVEYLRLNGIVPPASHSK
jgi:hypothetical protein